MAQAYAVWLNAHMHAMTPIMKLGVVRARTTTVLAACNILLAHCDFAIYCAYSQILDL